MRKIVCVIAAGFLIGQIGTPTALPADQPAAKPDVTAEEPKVSIEADDAKLKDLLESVARQSKKKIILESTVKGTVPHISAKDVTVEAALTALCKAAKLEWRKVYIDKNSKLLEQPDRLAATVRLVSAMGFPEMLISGASNGKLAAHYTQEKSVQSVQDIAAKSPGLFEVYVITNDLAVAEKEKEKEDKSGSKAIEDYVKQSQALLEKFVQMTPEEQEQAMIAGVNMFENMDPSYMASAIRAMSKIDPEVFARMAKRGTDMMLAMSQEDRRAMMKMNMRFAGQIPPNVLEMLQEDQKAVMEELKQEQENAPTPAR